MKKEKNNQKVSGRDINQRTVALTLKSIVSNGIR